MNPRWLLAIIASVLELASAAAQPANVVPYQGYPPVVVNNISGPDPYAIVGAPAGSSWWTNGLVLPNRESLRDRLWFRPEYLLWSTEGMDLPALVTSSPPSTPQIQAGVLGEPGTTILFGSNEINDGWVSGFRFRSGFWARQGAFGIEGEYFQLGKQDDGYTAGSDGTTILARPFFDITGGRESAFLISYPNLAAGNVSITSKSDLKSFLINARAALVPVDGVVYGVDGLTPADRIDWIVGYRYLELKDQLSIGQNLNSLELAAPGTAAVSDSFATKNKFSGLQLGVVYQANFRRAWLESLLRVGVGNNTQSVNISGNTSITESGATENFTGGLLAQRSNIGNYSRKQFTMVPEIGMTLGIRVTDSLRATVGYTVLYYPSVVRAGEQIDTDVNPNLIPPEADPFSGALRPRFRYIESDYWAQGINLGAELHF